MIQTEQWLTLDNAAKLFATTSSMRDPKVFRFACELYDQVDPQILQKAVDIVIERYEIYRSVLKHGLFWYYFERANLRPQVMREYKGPCAPIFDSNQKNLLFEVTYYGRRINLEVFHALMDGTGARNFLCDIVRSYIVMRYKDEIEPPIPKLLAPASTYQQADDSFSRYSQKLKSYYKKPNRLAYRIRGERLEDYRLGVIEGHCSASELLNKAREYDATVTELVTGIMILAIHDTMSRRDEERPVVITVPVNLRRFFPSKSARNFFGIVNITYDFMTDPPTLEAVAHSVKCQLEEQIDIEALQLRLDRLTAFDHHLAAKIMPLAVKNPLMRLGNAYVERKVTAAISNIGRITLEDKFIKFVKRFVFYTSTKSIQACICSFEDSFSVGFSSPFKNRNIQRSFFRRMSELGLSLDIVTNFRADD